MVLQMKFDVLLVLFDALITSGADHTFIKSRYFIFTKNQTFKTQLVRCY